ncbi:hypothetical protein F4861DRAFT_544829 [Xylaria intraflava]|nr:hypothetical protein F4861DRAFT_544829 [Xylaria intraflava]
MYKLLGRSRLLMEKGTDRPTKAPGTHDPDEPLHGGPDKNTLYYDAHATPIAVSSNVHHHVSCPPVTPASEPDMVDRPNSSGGLGPRKTAKDHFRYDKRMSRDDLYVGSSSYRGATHSQGQLSGPARPSAFGTNDREPSPDTKRNVHNGGNGVVLGGSTHSPDTRNPKRYAAPIPTPPTSKDNGVGALDIPLSRKPSGKWKLRSIFARKQSGQPLPAVAASNASGLDGINNRPEKKVPADYQTLPPDTGIPTRSNTTNSRKTPKHKPIVIRSQTLPLGAKGDIQHERLRENGRREGGKPKHIPITVDTAPGPSPAAGSLLSIEIPDIHLERYSVMFNNVLNSESSPVTRHYATVQKPKNLEDVIETEEEKSHGTTREASRQPAARSSGLLLFPTSKQSEHHMPHLRSPRLRSNTSPALPLEPSKAISNPAPSYKHPQGGETSNPPHPRHPAYHVEKPALAVVTNIHATEPGLPPVPNQSSGDKSNSAPNPLTEKEPVGDEVITRRPGNPVAYHLPLGPKRPIVSPSQNTPSAASPCAEDNLRKRSQTLASPSYNHAKGSSGELDDVPYPNIKMTPAEISIARQISVSRQQRKLLQPLNIGRSLSVSPGRKASYTTAARISPKTAVENGAEAETKSATPVSVHPPEIPGAHLALAQHRRSERAIPENA